MIIAFILAVILLAMVFAVIWVPFLTSDVRITMTYMVIGLILFVIMIIGLSSQY
jgi:hypothetical protein